MTVDDIIDACGGKEALKVRFGASRTAIYNWRHDGIPARFWPDVVQMADEAGKLSVTFEALRATSRSGRSAPPAPSEAAA